jgi:ATPase subunit of ABC transporter with duplicated ATPase domains
VAAANAAAQKKIQEDAARAEAQRKAQEESARAEAQRKAQEEAARAEAQRRAQASATVVAQADTPKQPVREASDARPAPSGGGAEVSSRRKTVILVGFSPDKSRVFVRTSEPVHYTVSQADDRTVVLELENTTFQHSNDRRPLDTRFFGGPVVEITPRPASGKTVRVAVTLRDKVGYQARQDGNEVSLQFAP